MSFTKYRDIPTEDIATDVSDDSADESYHTNTQQDKMAELSELRDMLRRIMQQNDALKLRVDSLEKGENVPKTRETTATLRGETAESQYLHEGGISDNESTSSSSFLSTSQLKAELDLVTHFDGRNISVETFISDIKNFLDSMSSVNHARAIKLITTQKIVNEARTAIDGQQIVDRDSLFEVLRGQYGNCKSYELAILERSQCVQGRESVAAYSRRFDQLHRDVRRSIINDPSNTTDTHSILLNNEDKIGLTQFVRGLKYKIKIRVQSLRPTTIKEAQNFSSEIEREEYVDEEIYRRLSRRRPHPPENDQRSHKPVPHGTFTNRGNPTVPQYNSSTTTASQPRRCFHCGSPHHFSRDCPKPRTQNAQNFPSRPPQTEPPNPTRYIECPKTEMLEQQSSSDWQEDKEENSWQIQEHPST